MKLSLKDLADALSITPGTVERWIRQGRIPARQKETECEFSLPVLKKWARDNNLKYTPRGESSRALGPDHLDTLAAAMERGGVFYDIAGDGVAQVLRSAVECIPCLQTPGHRTFLYESLVAREELMSTGIGRGVAIPHPRTPLDFGDIPPFITTCFLKNPMDYQAVDRRPVFVLFLLICPSSKQHLHLLARLSFCLREEAFIGFLAQRPDPGVFFQKIADLEQGFS